MLKYDYDYRRTTTASHQPISDEGEKALQETVRKLGAPWVVDGFGEDQFSIWNGSIKNKDDTSTITVTVRNDMKIEVTGFYNGSSASNRALDQALSKINNLRDVPNGVAAALSAAAKADNHRDLSLEDLKRVVGVWLKAAQPDLSRMGATVTYPHLSSSERNQAPFLYGSIGVSGVSQTAGADRAFAADVRKILLKHAKKANGAIIEVQPRPTFSSWVLQVGVEVFPES